MRHLTRRWASWPNPIQAVLLRYFERKSAQESVGSEMTGLRSTSLLCRIMKRIRTSNQSDQTWVCGSAQPDVPSGSMASDAVRLVQIGTAVWRHWLSDLAARRHFK